MHAEATLMETRPIRLLLIDDDEVLVRVGKRMIEQFGDQVSGFTRPAEAIAAFTASPDAFDVVMTDLNMPGLSGVEVIEALLAIRPDVATILVSGGGSDWDPESFQGAQQCLEKPYSRARLREVLDVVRARTAT